MREIKIGDEVFSKNDSEVYARVVNVSKRSIEISDGDEYDTIERRLFSDLDGTTWELPNWSINFE